MKRWWYVAAMSEEVAAGELVARRIYDDHLVLYRDANGAAHALADQCAHRGARLSDGKHEGDCVTCPFHGWAYAGDGRCTYIPANGKEAPIPHGAQVRSYPVQERAGLIWVYLGAPERMPELTLPDELTDEAWQSVSFKAHWKAHYSRVAESVIDVAHLPFVHPHTTGEVDPVVEGPDFTVTEDTICVIAKPFHPLLRTPLNEAEHREASTITLHFPNQLILRTNMAAENKMCTYLALTPTGAGTGEEETIIYGLALRNFLPDVELIDEIHYDHNVTVLDEDRPVVEGLRPQRIPLDIRVEQHVRADAQQVRYRQMLQRAWRESEREQSE
ncbi:MAG TPA: aromatic ring-hydroxylating dioxygenase subunit alpha [Bacilli bacterium]|nr:aromatic ring-hydroxylating dioxygenase subunit alpha [Bacilli bacterium]